MEKIIIVPFFVGFAYLVGILLYRGVKWIRGLSKLDKLRLIQSLKTRRTFDSIKEIFMEGLLHRKVFMKNKVLGYMHMCFAFGWFLLIAIGHLEVMIAEQTMFVPLYLPVFFRFFDTGKEFFLSGFFAFTMDLLLLFVLSGLTLAMIKRFKKQLFGLSKTTRLKTGDRIALTSLWLIFPLRLFAESLSANVLNNGSFLTNSFGHFLGSFLNAEMVDMPVWFAYSTALGFFFVALPNSRYMHIPSELMLIFLRNAGIKLKKRANTFTDVQVYSCSRCGICLDNCQLSNAGINDTQTVYFLKSIRNNNLNDERLFNCLMCGKCQVDCPVGIDIMNIRVTERIVSTLQYNSSYTYLEDSPVREAKIAYFAGCMTHLTPGIISAMKTIFAAAGDEVWFMDEEKAPCCGRPLMLAGQYDAASKLIQNNTKKILDSGATKLIISCPICYKVFKEDYELENVEVVFHAEYILNLIKDQKIRLSKTDQKYVYHDSCELGRGMGMYEEPREVLAATGQVITMKNERETSYCCGGSLGNLKITQDQRNKLRNHAVDEYLQYNPDLMVTACPMCKKTFARNKQVPVYDIAEIVVKSMYGLQEKKQIDAPKLINMLETSVV